MRIFQILILIVTVNACYSQSYFHLQKGDSTIDIVLGKSPYFYSIITEKTDSLIFYNRDLKKRSHDTIEIIASRMNDSTSLVQWINRRNNIVIQKGLFNLDGIANGEFTSSYYGDSSQTFFVNGYKRGREWYSSDGSFYVKEFVKGKLHGLYYILDKDKFIERITEYRNGVKHGFDRGYWIKESGSSLHYSHIYIDGKHRDGKAIVYHPDGSVFVEQNFKNGVLNGFLKVFGYNGSIMRMEKYRKGKLIKAYKISQL